MILPDVNVLISAHREDAVHHVACHRWLEGLLHGDAPFGMSLQVLASVVRVETNPRVFPVTAPLDAVLGFANLLLERPHCHVVRPGPQHWDIFCDLCRRSKAKGNLVQDAWFAALAIENGCTWITLDRDYARFDGLRWREPS